MERKPWEGPDSDGDQFSLPLAQMGTSSLYLWLRLGTSSLYLWLRLGTSSLYLWLRWEPVLFTSGSDGNQFSLPLAQIGDQFSLPLAQIGDQFSLPLAQMGTSSLYLWLRLGTSSLYLWLRWEPVLFISGSDGNQKQRPILLWHSLRLKEN